MKVILTPSNPKYTLIVYDLKTKKIRKIKSTPDQSAFDLYHFEQITLRHRPFGISWNDNNLFVVNRKHLLKFDHELNYLGLEEKLKYPNPHQILCHKESIFVTHARVNKVMELRKNDCRYFDVITENWAKSIPEFGTLNMDVHHVNSILATDDRLIILKHNKGFSKSEFLFLDHEFEVKKKLQMGMKCHSIASRKGMVSSISTLGGKLVRMDGFEFPILKKDSGMFYRGLGMTDNHYLIGCFKIANRRYRGEGGSNIRMFDLQGNFIEEYFIEDIGAINDLRIIDEFDYAHQVNPLKTDLI